MGPRNLCFILTEKLQIVPLQSRRWYKTHETQDTWHKTHFTRHMTQDTWDDREDREDRPEREGVFSGRLCGCAEITNEFSGWQNLFIPRFHCGTRLSPLSKDHCCTVYTVHCTLYTVHCTLYSHRGLHRLFTHETNQKIVYVDKNAKLSLVTREASRLLLFHWSNPNCYTAQCSAVSCS